MKKSICIFLSIISILCILCSCGNADDCSAKALIRSGNYYYQYELEGMNLVFAQKDKVHYMYQDSKKDVTIIDESGKKIVDYEKKQYALADYASDISVYALDGKALDFSSKSKVVIDNVNYNQYEYDYHNMKIGFVTDDENNWKYIYYLFPDVNGSTTKPKDISYIKILSYGTTLPDDYLTEIPEDFTQVTIDELFGS